MPGARQSLGAGHAGRPGTDDRDTPSGAARWRRWLYPALLPAASYSRSFDRLDRHRVVVDVQRATRLAGRRADAAGEFRNVRGSVQRNARLPPLLAVDATVPARDQIVDRAAPVTEREAAIHAARRLREQGRFPK